LFYIKMFLKAVASYIVVLKLQTSQTHREKMDACKEKLLLTLQPHSNAITTVQNILAAI